MYIAYVMLQHWPQQLCDVHAGRQCHVSDVHDGRREKLNSSGAGVGEYRFVFFFRTVWGSMGALKKKKEIPLQGITSKKSKIFPKISTV